MSPSSSHCHHSAPSLLTYAKQQTPHVQAKKKKKCWAPMWVHYCAQELDVLTLAEIIFNDFIMSKCSARLSAISSKKSSRYLWGWWDDGSSRREEAEIHRLRTGFENKRMKNAGNRQTERACHVTRSPRDEMMKITYCPFELKSIIRKT